MTWRFTSNPNVVSRVLQNGTVESHSLEAPEIAAWLAEGNTPEPYVAPPAPPPPPPPIDGATFLSRVTDDEYAAIVASNHVQVKRWLDIFRLRGEIDVTGTTAQAAKSGLVALGLLTQERANEIFEG